MRCTYRGGQIVLMKGLSRIRGPGGMEGGNKLGLR